MYCERQYKTQKSLSKHERLVHSESKKVFVCSLCGRPCRQAHTLKEHYRDIHKKKVSNEFANGRMKDDNGENLNKNKTVKMVKTVLEKMKCDDCQKVCTGMSNLRRHKKENCPGNKKSVAKPKTSQVAVSKQIRKHSEIDLHQIRTISTRQLRPKTTPREAIPKARRTTRSMVSMENRIRSEYKVF